jgi:hypothetical protein
MVLIVPVYDVDMSDYSIPVIIPVMLRNVYLGNEIWW